MNRFLRGLLGGGGERGGDLGLGCDLPGARWAVETARSYGEVVAGVALHPNEAPRLAAEGRLEEGLAEIERLAASSDRVRAVGETGLDRYRTGPEGWAAQEASFRAHIRIAKEHGVDPALQTSPSEGHCLPEIHATPLPQTARRRERVKV